MLATPSPTTNGQLLLSQWRELLPEQQDPLTHFAEGCFANTSVFMRCLISEVGRAHEPHFMVRKLKLGRVEVFSLAAQSVRAGFGTTAKAT